MTGNGSPCGACKFLRRKCVKGCIFAPYFCHEQGAIHFSAIHKVFGASNVSKLLSNLPVSDRCGAAISISYEAQARLKDPIYGCVSHIFALQQQIIHLQAQLASVKEQTAQSFVNGSSAHSCISTNPNDKYINNNGRHSDYLESFQNCFDQYYSNSNIVPPDQFSPSNLTNNMTSVIPYLETMSMEYSNNPSPGSCENILYDRVGEANSDQFMSSADFNEFQSMAFCSYSQHS